MANSELASIPPMLPTIPTPIKALPAPAGFAAAVRMASLCALARFAAAIVGSRMTAAFCRSLIICSSSLEAAMEFMPKLTTSIPRRSRQSAESSSFRIFESSTVCAGIAL